MKTILAILSKPPVTGFIALILLVGTWLLLARFALPLLGGTVAWIAVGIMTALWVLFSVFWWWRRRRNNEKVVEKAINPSDELIGVEGSALEQKFVKALGDLKRLRFKSSFGGSRYLYELPWYIFIGPPLSGKTEALQRCGLDFPLQRGKDGKVKIGGVGGTRDCDWFFTNEAVFIDTAGRYTTRSSDETIDSAAWQKFLDLLVKHRWREPINGVIVAVSIEDLATKSEAEREEMMDEIRKRILEVCERMEASIPIYVIFTKADLILGFNEFFQTLRRADRKQVWGATFPLNEASEPKEALAENLNSISEEFNELVNRLGAMQFRLLRDEPDLLTRAKIFGFPAQFSSMQAVIENFLRRTFEPDRYTSPIRLRGFYFTSATQIGQPVDRLIDTLSKDFGLERQPIPTKTKATGQPYFLSDLIMKVVLPEAGLATASRRRGIGAGRLAAIAACLLALVGLGAGFWKMNTYVEAKGESFEQASVDYRVEVAKLDNVTEVDIGDLGPVLPALTIWRKEIEELEGEKPPLPAGLGIDSSPLLLSRSEQSYEIALEKLLRPRLIYLFEDRIRAGMAADDERAVYNALKAYLLVVGATGSTLQGNIDFLKQQIQTAAQEYDPEAGGDPLTGVEMTALTGADGRSGHVGAWLASEKLTPWRSADGLHINQALIDEARKEIDLGYAERALEELETIAEDTGNVADWDVETVAGPSLKDAFVTRRGGPVKTIVPALYTKAGFWSVYDAGAERAVQKVLEESWVLESDESRTPSQARILSQVDAEYFDRYIHHWENVLLDMRARSFDDARGAASVIEAIAAPTLSPLKRIVEDVVSETALDVVPGTAIGSAARGVAREQGLRETVVWLSRQGMAGRFAQRMIGSSTSGAEPPVPGKPVIDHFEALRDFATQPDGLDRLMDRLGTLERVLSNRDVANDVRLLGRTEAGQAFTRGIESAPALLKPMLEAVLSEATAISSAGARQGLREAWRNEVYAQCVRRLHDRYPFGTRSDTVLVRDLTDLLGPGGRIQRFFEENLENYVDINSWTWTPEGRALGISQERLDFFREAETLRRAFFQGGENRPDVTLTMRVKAPPNTERVAVTIGGVKRDFGDDFPVNSTLSWPGPQGGAGVEITVFPEPEEEELPTPLEGDSLVTITPPPRSSDPLPPLRKPVSGAWGLFRLMDESGFRIVDGGSRGTMAVRVQGKRTVLQLQMETATNPFSLRNEIRRFRCPDTL